jgi:hypothetical protein
MRGPILFGIGAVIALWMGIATARAEQIFIVCHGEFESTCKSHPYTLFENCGSDKGGGGANPRASGMKLCGNDRFDIASAEGGSVGGNRCGYTWFRITCR